MKTILAKGGDWSSEQSFWKVPYQGYIVALVLGLYRAVKLLAASQTGSSIGHMTESHAAQAGLILSV